MTLNDFFNLGINAEFLDIHGYNTEEDEGTVHLDNRVINEIVHSISGAFRMLVGLKRCEELGLLTEEDRDKIWKWSNYHLIDVDFEAKEIVFYKEETK